MHKTQIGIVGYGSFGKLLAQLASELYEVRIFDRAIHTDDDLPAGAKFVDSYGDFSDCNAIFIATGLDSMESVCLELKAVVTKDTVVADVCSVKVRPAEIMQRVLGDSCHLLATHPLFGPQTVLSPADARGQKLVWHSLTDGDFGVAKELFEHLGIEIVELDPAAHDKEMAWVHGLTFFTGRALLDMNPPTSTLGTNYYQKLVDLVAVESQHSEELFMTIQRGNPFTDEIRQKFMGTLQKYEDKIKEEQL